MYGLHVQRRMPIGGAEPTRLPRSVLHSYGPAYVKCECFIQVHPRVQGPLPIFRRASVALALLRRLEAVLASWETTMGESAGEPKAGS